MSMHAHASTRHNSRKIRDTLNNLILKVNYPTRQILASYTINAPLLTFSRLCVAQSPQNWQTSVRPKENTLDGPLESGSRRST